MHDSEPTGATSAAPGEEPGRGQEADDPDSQFRAVCAEVRKPAASAVRWWVLPLTAALFFVGARLVSGWLDVLLVVVVIAVHELGHYAAMRLVGYRDVRVFFVPFLGAATTGTREDAEAWQRAVVALAGPVPGVLAALGLALALPDDLFSQGHRAVGALLIINGFNLLPFEPLDGGRMLGALVFSRLRWLETLFGVASGAALAVLGATLQLWVLLAIGLLLAVLAPGRHRLRGDAMAVARRVPSWRARLEDNPEPALRTLYLQALRQFHGLRVGAPTIASRMRAIHQRAVQRPASGGAIALWLLVYALVVVVTLAAGGVLLARAWGVY